MNRSTTISLSLVLLAMICGLVSCYQPTPEPEDDEVGDDYPAFSPDGKFIAYTSWGQNPGLYIIDEEGGNKKLVLPVLSNEQCESPSWSPDGQWLVFSKGHFRKLFKCKINGDSLKELTAVDSLPFPKFSSPNWSKNNKHIVFSNSELKDGMGLYQTNVDFTNSKMLFALGQFYAGGDPEFSPDATHLIFYDGNKDNGYPDIFTSDTLGNQRVRLTNNGKYNFEPTWSPDGQKIAWSKDGRLSTMNANGANQMEIGDGSDPSWSVNDEIVFSNSVLISEDECARYHREYLYIISPDGKNKRQITF